MIQANINWFGDEAEKAVLRAGWEGVRRAAHYFWERLRDVLNKSNPGQQVRGGGRGKGGKSFTVYPSPSKPGEPPRLRSGYLRSNVLEQYDEAAMEAVVGLGANARYGLVLELGSKGGQVITPKSKKALAWYDHAAGKMRFAKRLTRGELSPRPWFMVTLLRFLPQLRLLAGGGGP